MSLELWGMSLKNKNQKLNNLCLAIKQPLRKLA